MSLFFGSIVLLDNATITDYHVHFRRYYHVHFWRYYSLARQRNNRKLSCSLFFLGSIVLLDNATNADYHVHFWRFYLVHFGRHYHVHFWRHYSLARQCNNHKLPCFLSVVSSHFACVFCFIRLLVRSVACLTSSETCFKLYISHVLLIKRRILDKTESSIYLYLYYGFYYYFLKRKWFDIPFRCFVVFLF